MQNQELSPIQVEKISYVEVVQLMKKQSVWLIYPTILQRMMEPEQEIVDFVLQQMVQKMMVRVVLLQ